MNRFQTLLYPPVTLLDVARDDGNVAVVYDREEVEDRHIQARVVASEEVGGAAYPLRAEAGPALKVAPVSNGAPTIAASAFARSRAFGRRMKVRTSEKRGVSKESAGSYLVKRPSHQCRIRTPSPALWPPRTGLSALDQTGGATRRPPE